MTPRFRFKPEMFVFSPSILIDTKASFHAADQANAALDEYLKTCREIYLKKSGSHELVFWDMVNAGEGETHEAILFDLRPIEKPECEHEPELIYPTTFLDSSVDSDNFQCKKCGAKLKAKWEEVK